ncbi:hypothetical protein ABH926_003405 [Catenulispora sp. GP43]|uniref:DUF6084 family protein n=1 Tax=Catenulispora sp. GP43 TaxID=3156263 RepID=UPI0035174B36
MSELAFTVLDISPEPYAAAPNLAARLRITEATGERVHAIALRCQVQIEPRRRSYNGEEKTDLADLFGAPARWGETLRPVVWTQASTMVPGFTGSVDVDLPLPCTYDFEVAAAKYLQALAGDDVPLTLLFSGTVFTRGLAGFGVEQIPWHLEASYRMPIRVWRELMDAHFPNTGWIRLDRETLRRLGRYRSERALTDWGQVFDALLPAEELEASR